MSYTLINKINKGKVYNLIQLAQKLELNNSKNLCNIHENCKHFMNKIS